MIRKIVLTITLCMLPALVHSQTVEFTVKAASASIYKSPSTGSPVIGRAPRGTQLEVMRELGDWLKVSWPNSEEGSGYVHASFGTLAPGLPRAGSTTQANQPPSAPAATVTRTVRDEGFGTVEPPVANRSIYVAPPTHIFGIGGLMAGSAPAFGATTRLWSRSRLGVQVEFSRASTTAADASTRMTSLQFAPGVIFSLTDVVTDNVWLRPYVGGGISFIRSKLSSTTIDGSSSPAESTTGYRIHGGSEITFPSVPKFAVSADLGYQPHTTPFDGYELGGFGLTVAAHWYVK